MGHPKRKLCLLVLLSSSAFAQTPPVGTIRLTPAQIVAQSGAIIDVDSGRLYVPENRARSGSRTISLHLLRFRARGAAKGAPLIYVSGGSGAGTIAARGPRLSLFQSLTELGDVIAFDLRGGTGASLPMLRCRPGVEGVALDRPLVYDTIIAALRTRARMCGDSLRSAGVDLAGYTMQSMADDIESIRRAFDVPKVRLWGISTGTHIAIEYIRRYPDRVESAVLAGVEGPGQTVDLPLEQDAVLEELGKRMGSTVLPRSLLDSLDRRPVITYVRGPRGDSVKVAVGRLEAQLFASAMLGSRRQMATLPSVFEAAAAGDVSALAAFKVQAATQFLQSTMESIVDCQSPASAARERERIAQTTRSLLGWGTSDFPEACDGWKTQKPGLRALPPVRAATPVLFIAGTLDGRTSVASAREVMRGFPNSGLLLLDGASHGDDLFLADPAIAERIRSFFATRLARSETITIPD